MTDALLHRNLTASRIHSPFSYIYADSTARLAATGFVPADVYKTALQLSDASAWILTDDSPITWAQIGGTAGGSAGGDLSGTYPNPTVAKIGGVAVTVDTDGALASNSDAKLATQKATKTYVDGAVIGLFEFKGSTDCSSNPNYPSALKGDSYLVSVAGKIGGASGKSVDVGDVYIANADNAGGTEAGVGTAWFVLEHNLVSLVDDTAYDATSWNGDTTHAPSKNAVRDKIETLGVGSGDVVGPSSATDGHLALFDGTTGKLIKDGGAPGGGSGALVQRKGSQSGAVASGTTTIPYDDTIPQNTEGDEYLTQAITPTNSSNILWIDVTIFGSVSGADYMIVALFQDTTANALASAAFYIDTGTATGIVHFRFKMTAGTTSATTFKVRAGRASAGTFMLNGRTSTGRVFGGVAASSLTIDEVTP